MTTKPSNERAVAAYTWIGLGSLMACELCTTVCVLTALLLGYLP